MKNVLIVLSAARIAAPRAARVSRGLLVLSMATIFATACGTQYLIPVDDLDADSGDAVGDAIEGDVLIDADTEPAETGALGGDCYGNGTCNSGLRCVLDRCEREGAAGGELGGPCFVDGTCNAGLACEGTTCVPERPVDPVDPGQEGDLCDAARPCRADLSCVAGRCARDGAVEGTVGGQCRADGGCDGDLVCEGNICRRPPPSNGGLGERCRADGTCDGALICVANLCQVDAGPSEGGLGEPCRADGSCDGRLVCDEGLCARADGSCRVPVIDCRVGSVSVSIRDIQLEALESVACTVSDPEGPPGQTYQWELVESPERSVALPSFDASDGSMTFDGTVVGEYVLEMTPDDFAPCDGRTVHVEVLPMDGIYVELTWDTPGDPNRHDTGFGTGTDADLHMRHPNGCWGDPLWDCHWRNSTPRWGPSAGDGDPELLLDQLYGWGPEVISMLQPRNERYRVGVNYFADNGFGGSNMMVRVYLDGVLVYDDEAWLDGRDDFWEVAEIDWNARTVTPLGAVTSGALPTCL